MIILSTLIYLLAAVLFILGLKFLSSPSRARVGNGMAALGMAIALIWTVITLWPYFTPLGIVISIIGVVAGTVVGAIAARQVKLTAMPQLVAIFNGVGGGAAALVALIELINWSALTSLDSALQPGWGTTLPSVLAIIIGGVSFSGSAIAFAKLQELMPGRPITYRGQQLSNALLGAVTLLLAVVVIVGPASPWLLLLLLLLALGFGVAFVLPIGGADMPVVISLLNAFTGLAVAASGFILDSFVLIIAGTLVGSSGTILTKLMSTAMGRSLSGILFGAFGQPPSSEGEVSDGAAGNVRTSSVEDIATMLAYAEGVIIVPGYGLAVAQAQHVVRELADELEQRGVEVRYAIHPVAGRMPGHMNVL
ncbi:MAG: NAD(P)(+) transhydrogenase (Re/Si-specific) subunit beta, partial [Candidatus Dormibacteraceae bacterium]